MAAPRSLATQAQKEIDELDAQIKLLVERREELVLFIKVGQSLKYRPGTVNTEKNFTVKSAKNGTPAKSKSIKKLKTTAMQSGKTPITKHKRGNTQDIIQACTSILQKQSPLKPAELLPAVLEDGVSIPGKDTKQQLMKITKILSKSRDIFQSDRRLGWSLKAV